MHMDDDILFDDDDAAADFGDELEFEGLDESDPEVEQLIARVYAARLAGA